MSFFIKQFSKTPVLKGQQGFTLLELLIAIAIVAILAVVAFVALNPQLRFQDARDATRWTDVSAILDAAKIQQVDNGGLYVTQINSLTSDTDYMIGTATTGCDDSNAICDVDMANDTNCVNLNASDLVVDGYLAKVPVSPNGDSTANWDAAHTGYYLRKSSTGNITVGACEAEQESAINVAR